MFNLGIVSQQISSFPFGPAGWYDPSDASTITSSGGSVSALADKSGNLRNLTQATGASRPTTGTRSINGLNVLDYDGNDTLSSSTPLVDLVGGQSMTIFAVVQDDLSISAFRVFASQWTVSIQRQFATGTDISGNYYVGTSDVGVVSSIPSTTLSLIKFTYNNPTDELNLNINGTNAGSIFTSITAGNSNFTLGGTISGGTWNGIIGEIIVYNKLLNSFQETEIVNYLNNKWGLIPASISNLRAWYDPSEVSTITSSGGLVSALADKSLVKFNATQGTGARQPSTGLTTQNGLNVLSYSGVNKGLVASGVAINRSSAFHLFAVVQSDNPANLTFGNFIGQNTTPNISFGFNVRLPGLNQYRFVYSSPSFIEGGLIDGSFQLLEAAYDGTTIRLFVDGAQVASVNATPSSANFALILGNVQDFAFGLTGKLGEVIVYNKYVSGTEATNLRNYLNEKWGM